MAQRFLPPPSGQIDPLSREILTVFCNGQGDHSVPKFKWNMACMGAGKNISEPIRTGCADRVRQNMGEGLAAIGAPCHPTTMMTMLFAMPTVSDHEPH